VEYVITLKDIEISTSLVLQSLPDKYAKISTVKELGKLGASTYF